MQRCQRLTGRDIHVELNRWKYNLNSRKNHQHIAVCYSVGRCHLSVSGWISLSNQKYPWWVALSLTRPSRSQSVMQTMSIGCRKASMCSSSSTDQVGTVCTMTEGFNASIFALAASTLCLMNQFTPTDGEKNIRSEFSRDLTISESTYLHPHIFLSKEESCSKIFSH